MRRRGSTGSFRKSTRVSCRSTSRRPTSPRQPSRAMASASMPRRSTGRPARPTRSRSAKRSRCYLPAGDWGRRMWRGRRKPARNVERVALKLSLTGSRSERTSERLDRCVGVAVSFDASPIAMIVSALVFVCSGSWPQSSTALLASGALRGRGRGEHGVRLSRGAGCDPADKLSCGCIAADFRCDIRLFRKLKPEAARLGDSAGSGSSIPRAAAGRGTLADLGKKP